MAAPVWETGTTLAGASAASAVVTIPTGVAAGDIVLVTLYKEDAGAVTPPSGYTEKGTAPTTTAPQAQHTFWHRATGSESGTVTFTWTNSAWRAATASRISGCAAAGDPIEDINTAASSSSVSTLNVSLAATSTDTLLYWAGTDFAGGNTWTPPTGYTERADIDVIGDATKANTAGGATGNVTGTANVSGALTAVLLALLPETGNVVLQAPETDTALPVTSNQPYCAYDSSGALAYSASAGTSVAPAYPGTVASGDLLVLVVGQKPSTANGGTVTTPSGWTLAGSQTAAGGYGTTLGADTGNTNLFVYVRESDGTETGTLAVTVGTNGVCWGQIHRFTRLSADGWSTALAVGSDTTAGDVSAAMATDPGLSPRDVLLAAVCIPTDVTTPAQFSGEAVTATGATIGTATEVSEPDSTVGNDIGGVQFVAVVTAGTSSAEPVVSATAGGTTTNVRGPVVLLRVRATQSAAQTVSVGPATETGTAPAVTVLSPVTVAVGKAAEVLQAATIPAAHAAAVAPATETGTAVAVTHPGPVLVGAASETSAVPSAAAVKTATVGPAAEAGTAPAVPAVAVGAVGQATSTDTAVPVTAGRVAAVGQAVETGTAAPVTSGAGQTPVGPAPEVDAAPQVVPAWAVPVGQASCTAVSRPVAAARATGVGQAAETGSGVGVVPARAVPVAPAAETSTAAPVTGSSPGVLGRASDTSTAAPVTVVRVAVVAPAVEVGAAVAARPATGLGVAQAVDAGTASALARAVKVAAASPAGEVDVAGSVYARAPGELAPAAEVDVAWPVGSWLVGERGRLRSGRRRSPVGVGWRRSPVEIGERS